MRVPDRRRSAGPLVALAALTVLGAACGTSTGGPTSAASPSSSGAGGPARLGDAAAVAAATPDQAAIALLPASIKASRTIQAAVIPDIPPMMFTDSSNQLVGVEHDLLAAAARVLQVHIVFNPVQLDEMVPGITSGRYQVGAGSITDIKKRETKVDIIDYAEYGQGLAVAAGNPKQVSFDNLCGRPVAGTEGSLQLIAILPALSKTCVASGHKPIAIKSFPTITSQFLALSSGRVDASMLNFATVAYYVKQAHGQLSVAASSYQVDPKGVLVSKTSGLTPALQAALEVLDADGTIQKIFSYWGLQGVTLSRVALNAATH